MRYQTFLAQEGQDGGLFATRAPGSAIAPSHERARGILSCATQRSTANASAPARYGSLPGGAAIVLAAPTLDSAYWNKAGPGSSIFFWGLHAGADEKLSAVSVALV
jgi:hypothetical protein